MQAFLSLVDSDKRDPNENYARELMELFTLGVTGRLHRARRPRGGPRADRLQGQLARRPAADRQPTTPSATTTAPSSCSATAGASTGRTCCASSSATARTRPSSWASCGTSSSPSRCRRRTRRRLARVYVALAPPHRAGRARDPRQHARSTPTSTTRRWSSGRSSSWPATCAWSGARVDTDDWAWISSMMGQMPFSPPSVAGLGLGRRRGCRRRRCARASCARRGSARTCP